MNSILKISILVLTVVTTQQSHAVFKLFGGKAAKPQVHEVAPIKQQEVNQLITGKITYHIENQAHDLNLGEIATGYRSVMSSTKDKSQKDTLAKYEEVLIKLLSHERISNLSQDGNTFGAFLKQLLVLKESSLKLMTADQISSHMEILSITLTKIDKPDLQADKAYYEALKEKYKNEADSKLKEILSCS